MPQTKSSISCNTSARLNVNQQVLHLFPPYDDELVHLLFPNLKFQSDDELESWITYLAREIAEANLNHREKSEIHHLEDWLKVLQKEKNRRVELVKHGAPRFEGQNRFSKELVDDVKSYYSGNNFLALFYQITNLTPESRGSKWIYRCPHHGDGIDKNPSGVLYPDESRYWCHGCNSGGDIFTLLEVFPPNLTFAKAVRQLAEWAGIKVQLIGGKRERIKERLKRHAK